MSLSSNQARWTRLAAWALIAASMVAAHCAAPDSSPPSPITHQVYQHLLEPREHPDYDRRPVQPPSWDTFKQRTQFTALRGFEMDGSQIVRFVEELEKFTRTYELGDVIWPAYPILMATNLDALAEEIKRRDLYLFDIWGYVPGSGPGGYWQQFKPPASAFAALTAKLGDRWLGTDIGEQDGRYIGGYAGQMTPSSASRFEQYLNFQRHFERMGDDLGHRHATLVSLNYGHYFLKEGTYTLIGAETAQALPNNQVYYAFIRGAGKQYGVPWFGNASIYNRWGYKSYDVTGGSGGDTHGPTKGTSLSLMKRLLYHHILYNCVAVGFENGWFDGNALSPIGRIQQSAQRWIKTNGQPGVMHTPVALLLDFYSGWTFPRHLYSDKIYRVWGNLPYEPGDFFTDAVLDLLYPGYQDSSYFHDESGFIVPTPYGDIADCLLSDAPAWLLARYPTIIVAGELAGGREIRDKLQAYLDAGGHLAITGGNLAKLPGGLAGHTNASPVRTIPCGQGSLTLLSSDFGLEPQSQHQAALRSDVDRSLPKPYRLREEVRAALTNLLQQQSLLGVGSPQLSYVTCRQSPGLFTLGVANSTWHELPLSLASHCGQILSIRELQLDSAETSAAGCWPEGVSGPDLGRDTEHTIAGGSMRVFQIKVREASLEEIPHLPPPRRPTGRILPVGHPNSIKAAILARPTFFEHFDGIVADWRYLHDREIQTLKDEADWLGRQRLRIMVDLSSGLNLYPTLRIINNLTDDYAASMAMITNLIVKMEAFGARDLILSLHRYPENNFTDEQSLTSFKSTLNTLATEASRHSIALHLRLTLGKPPWNLEAADTLLSQIDANNLRLAVSTALLANDRPTPKQERILRERTGLWLAAGSERDFTGSLWNVHAPLSQVQNLAPTANLIKLCPRAPILCDTVFNTFDEEYQAAQALDRVHSLMSAP
jgi:hypothetical protein